MLPGAQDLQARAVTVVCAPTSEPVHGDVHVQFAHGDGQHPKRGLDGALAREVRAQRQPCLEGPLEASTTPRRLGAPEDHVQQPLRPL
eukprot:7716103-Lingulodinium_polyedra.AAC.1